MHLKKVKLPDKHFKQSPHLQLFRTYKALFLLRLFSPYPVLGLVNNLKKDYKESRPEFSQTERKTQGATIGQMFKEERIII